MIFRKKTSLFCPIIDGWKQITFRLINPVLSGALEMGTDHMYARNAH